MDVNFLQGLKANLPESYDINTLLFTSDTGEIYKGDGADKPLVYYGSVMVGYTDLSDLRTKAPTNQTKLYLTNDNKLYTYDGTDYILISGSESMDSTVITFDGSATDLTSTNVQDAIVELDGKIDGVDGKVNALELALTASLGKVKVNESDTADYLGTKLHSTIELAEGKLKVVGVDGLSVGITDINTWLTGTESNIQTQINDVKDELEALATGLNYVGNFGTLTLLEARTGNLNGDLAVVTNDGLNESSTLYVYSEATTAWLPLGKFEFSETFIGLKDTPANYEGSTGKVLKSNGVGVVFGEITYDELVGKPNVSVADIEDAIAKKHEHTNNVTLSKLGEDADGNLTYDNKPVTPQWGTFEI